MELIRGRKIHLHKVNRKHALKATREEGDRGDAVKGQKTDIVESHSSDEPRRTGKKSSPSIHQPSARGTSSRNRTGLCLLKERVSVPIMAILVSGIAYFSTHRRGCTGRHDAISRVFMVHRVSFLFLHICFWIKFD